MKLLKFGFIAVLMLGAFACASRRVTPSDWNALTETPAGTGIQVELRSGEIIRGAYQDSSQNEMMVLDESGDPVTASAADVREITSDTTDSLLDGAMMGLAVGGVGGVLSTAFGGGAEAFWTTFGWSVGLGVFLDWLSPNREVLYRAP